MSAANGTLRGGDGTPNLRADHMEPRPAERFLATSVTGFPEVCFGGPPTTRYQVLDRPYCYELVLETPSKPAAERLAEILNAGQWDYAREYATKLERDRVNGKRYRGRHRWKRSL